MPPLKDYYHILNVSPSASAEDIKKAFRKLALIYHPDKTNGAISFVEKFANIQEAYGVLSDSKKRSDYHYHRYRETTSQKPLPETADELLLAALKLQKQIAQFDPFRIDTDLVYYELKDLLCSHNTNILQISGNTTVIISFIHTVLNSLHPLSYERTKEIIGLLSTIDADSIHQKIIKDYLKNSYLLHIWNRNSLYFALIVSIILCLCIFFLTRV